MGSVDEAADDALLQGLGLSDRKRNLLEARLLGQSNSLDAANSNSMGSQGSLRSQPQSCRRKEGGGQELQQPDVLLPPGGGVGMGSLTSPVSGHRSSGTEPTLLEVSDSHSHNNTPSSREGRHQGGRAHSPSSYKQQFQASQQVDSPQSDLSFGDRTSSSLLRNTHGHRAHQQAAAAFSQAQIPQPGPSPRMSLASEFNQQERPSGSQAMMATASTTTTTASSAKNEGGSHSTANQGSRKRQRTREAVSEVPARSPNALKATAGGHSNQGANANTVSPGRFEASNVKAGARDIKYFFQQQQQQQQHHLSSQSTASMKVGNPSELASSLSSSSSSVLGVSTLSNSNGEDSENLADDVPGLKKRLKDAERTVRELTVDVARAKAEKLEQEQQGAAWKADLIRAQEENLKLKEYISEKEKKAATVMEEILRKLAQYQDREARESSSRNTYRLGRIVTSRSAPHGMTEVWEEGHAAKELQRQSAELLQRKDELEKRKKQIAKESRKAAAIASSVGGEGGDSSAVEGSATIDELQAIEAEETVKMHLGQLKKDEASVQESRRMLEKEKSVYIRELRRIQHEDRSRFSRHPVVNGRYLLMSLLGRGGFSEVWRAFDLRDYDEVAVKIHQLNSQWTEEKKQNYMKHASREYAIHREMVHPRVVRLYDVFEIDNSSFATVLEFCKGTDLDYVLKTQRSIPERDARAIIIQILCGLKYLNTPSGEGAKRRQAIIHYDLKPGNILFDESGNVKITDFGLSKIIDDSCDGASLELTSQGAGTYWYLPPECFVMGSSPPRISSKVDVWALGVIFYQMLFGSRPFGEGQSQEKLLHENTMLRATHVDFPTKPVVSAEAKEFLRACLTHSQVERPDVHKLCNHSYLRLKKLST